MIAEFINSSLEYLLGDTDSAGRLRRSELVEGNLPSLLEARKMAAKYKHPHITVSYREPKPLERIGGYGFEKRLKEDILETFLPGLDRSQFHYAFIRHHNGDGSYELNFFLLQMTSGRQFTAYWDKKDRKLHELLSRKIHQENRSLTNPWEERPELIVPARASINDGAKTAKEIEELLETTIEGYKTAAQDAAEAAADSEAFAAQNAQEAEDFRDEAEEFAAAAQNSKAAAELAAGTAVNSSDLAALCRRAANVGFFQFESDGKLSGAGVPSALPLSFCATVNLSAEDLAAMTTSNYIIVAAIGKSGAGVLSFGLIRNNASQFAVFIWAYTSSQDTSVSCFVNEADLAGLHTLVFSVRELSGGVMDCDIYFDGIRQNTAARTSSLKEYPLTGAQDYWIHVNNPIWTGTPSPMPMKLSKLKIFNFDMSAEGAPYSVADYAAGIEPSPVLMLGTPATSDSAMGASTGEGWTQGAVSNTTGTSGDWRFGSGTTYVKNRELTQADYDGGLPESITSAVDLKTVEFIGFNGVLSNFCNDAADFSQYAGKTLKAKISFWMRNNAVTSQKTITIGTGYSVFKQISAADQTNYPNGIWKRVSEIVECKFPENLAATNYRIGIAANSKGADDNDYCVSIADFKFEILGANLALSDAADASQIRDESSNGNHALISGAVLPSKSNNPAHCSQTITWAGTSTLQNVCGDAAIPANSKVTAYAKATGAVTASFKAGANAAQSKELAANTLTEIGSWLCGAAGAFSVQPSAAYTGSIETYLKIERF